MAYGRMMAPVSSNDSDAPTLHAPGGTTVRALLSQPVLRRIVELVAGADGLDRPIDHPRIQKSGLVLVGHEHGLVPTRVQIFGETELSYFETLAPEVRRARAEMLFRRPLSLVVVTRGVRPPVELVEAAARTGTPLAMAHPRSSRTIQLIHRVLDRILAPTQAVHGVLIDIHGMGVLLRGPSGIGKSECALFLLERGHRLVADDQVVLSSMPGDYIVGRSPPLLRYHLEVRGIGIINVRELFGAPAVSDEKNVQLLVDLSPASERQDVGYDRLGVDDKTEDVLGVPVPVLEIPVRPGRNMAVILEVAARNQLLKRAGHHPARDFVRTLESHLDPPDDPDR